MDGHQCGIASVEQRGPLGPWLLAALLLALAAGPARALPKTDTVTLFNGDRTTCEVKELIRGRLTVKTVGMSTVSIEWDKIVRIDSRYAFLVKQRDGTLAFGRLPDSGEDGILLVEYVDSAVRIPMADVVEIQPSRLDVWDRIAISVSLGVNYTKATEITQVYLDGSVAYKGPVYASGINADSTVSESAAEDLKRRHDLGVYTRRRIGGNVVALANAGFQRNDELGLRARVLGGGGLGYYLATTNHLELLTSADLNLNREWANLDSPAENNLEARISVGFAVFYYNSPKVDLRFDASVIPNLTTAGRVRFELETALRYELAKDLFVELKYYESRDNKPPAGASAKDDRGLVFAVGWTK